MMGGFYVCSAPVRDFYRSEELSVIQQINKQGRDEKDHHAEDFVEIKEKKLLYNQKFYLSL